MNMPEPDRSLDRRALLAAGGLLIPAALTAAACSRDSDGGGEKEASRKAGGGKEEVTPNEDLMREHGVLRRILIVYREAAPLVLAGSAVDAGALNQAATLFRAFGESYHEKMLEEAHVFPAVRKTGGPAANLPDILVAQHERGRQVTAFLIDQTRGGRIATGQARNVAAAMTGFARMYEAHSAREDTIVFPAFKKALPESRFKELGEQFEEIEHKQFGADGFEVALNRVASIEGALGLSDLATFTAPPPAA